MSAQSSFAPRLVGDFIEPRLHIDGVPHDVGEAAVVRQREAFPGTLPWSLELAGPAVERLLRVVPTLTTGRPSPSVAGRLLDALRSALLRRGPGWSRFALITVDRVEVSPGHARLAGTCAPLVQVAPSASEPVV